MTRWLVVAGLVAGLGGCASPEPAYFTLAPVPAVGVAGGPRQVELRRIGLAGYLDRPEIVRANGAYSLKLAGTERWGEPLGDLVARILAEDLNARLPGTSVFTASGAISAEANATVELDIQRFGAGSSGAGTDAVGEVTLLAQVAVSRGRGRANAVARAVRLQVRPAGPGTGELVAAMSQALGLLADAVAGMLRGG